MTLSTSRPIALDTWVKATWDEFAAAIDTPEHSEGRGYFDQGYMRIEMAPLGAGHGRQNAVVMDVVSIFAMLHRIRIAKFINCSFHKTGVRGCQPDIAFYVGKTFQLPPQDNAPVDVDIFGAPALAIEVGASSFKDDLGSKRLLYERLGVAEYWVVNVAEKQVIAFAIANGYSGQIDTSAVLPGLTISMVEEALVRSQTEDDSGLLQWLMDTLR